MNSGLARAAAGLVALAAWTGLAIQLDASTRLTGSLPDALWVMLRYFTILANLSIAGLFSAVAMGSRAAARPALLAGITLIILLVGVVYGLLLRGLLDLSGGARLADTILHKVTPIIVTLWWLLFAPKRGLRYGHAIVWALPPLAYLGYALWRGGRDGIYAYPFINVAKLGMTQVLINAALIGAGFVAAGLALVWLSRQVAKAG